MAQYKVKFTCGHEDTVSLFGKGSYREWKLKQLQDDLCPSCQTIQNEEIKAEKNRKAAEEAEEWGLAELIGTEKQATWANTIRMQRLNEIDTAIKDVEEGNVRKTKYCFDMTDKKIVSEVKDFICAKTDATWFINNRQLYLHNILEKCNEEMQETKKAEQSKKDVIDFSPESIVAPENQTHTGFVEIIGNDEEFKAIYQKDYDMIKIVKDCRMKWTGSVWKRDLNELRGSFYDRAAELGNKLLKEGFAICIHDETVRNAAVSGNYEDECDEWICFSADTNMLYCIWGGRNDILYKRARSIKGSKYSDGKVFFQLSEYEEVLDFAKRNNFKVSKRATQVIEEYQNKLSEVNKVEPADHEKAVVEDGLKAILKSKVQILDELRDDD